MAATEFTVYCDDGGHPDDQECVLAAGFVGEMDQWLIFEKEWKHHLGLMKIESGAIHMTEFCSTPPGKAYAHLSNTERKDLLDTLITMIKTRCRFGFFCIVPMADYKDANEIYALEECFGKPFAMAGRHVVGQAREWAQKFNHENNPVLVVFEDGTKHKGDLVDICIRDGHPAPSFAKKKDVVPLQAADIFAWECFHTFDTGEFRPSLRRLLDFPHSKAIFTYERLLENCEKYEVAKRKSGVEFDVRIAKFKKKPRHRKIFGSGEGYEVRGRDRL
jgi:hypothetical protein